MWIQLNDVESEESLSGLGFSRHVSNYEFATINFYREDSGPDPNNIQTFMFQVNRAKVLHKRSIYTFWDFLADVGGLYDMLIVIGGWAMTIIQTFAGSGLSRYIVNRVFYVERKKSASSDMSTFEKVHQAF